MNPPSPQPRLPEAHSSGLSLGDLQYIFFRHKWLILAIFILGLGGAAGIWFLKPPVYQSDAHLLVRYVLDDRSTARQSPDTQVVSTDARGENIMNSQMMVIASYNLASQVAEAVGPEKILAALGGGSDKVRAASVVQRNLFVDVPKKSNILLVRFRHPDPAIAQSVLAQVVEAYMKRHVELYRDTGALDEFFSKQADQLRARLSQTEDELKKLKTDAQVISLEDSKQANVAEETTIKRDLNAAEAELAERQAALSVFVKTAPAQPETNAPAVTVPPETAEKYRMVAAECEAFRRREQELLMRFASEHPFILRIREQLQDAEARKKQLELDTPVLLTIAPPTMPATSPSSSGFDPAMETSRVLAIQAKIRVLTNQLDRVRADARKIADNESAIVALTRKRDMEDTGFRDYTAKLQQARIEESLGGEVRNIKVVQSPTPPGRDIDEIKKPLMMALAFGLLGGFALAFLLEKVLHQSIKRVADLEQTLRVPVLMAVPDLSWRKRFSFRKASRNGHGPPPTATTVQTDAPSNDARSSGRESAPSSRDSVDPSLAITSSENRQVQPWDADHELRAYYEALRDRLITYFEVRNMTHKPKLVALTSCHKGAGVTTMASGLAAALSETGDGNVLLVDMNLEQGAAHPFYRGKPAIGLSEAFDAGKPETGIVNENLYLVSAKETNDQKLPRVLPRRFANLVPKMKASDYDYIIFDMPPVSQTSVTPRLSSFMDIVMMVVESEKTGSELAKRANALLQESKANVTAVLNKKRDYVPERLRQEL